MAVDTPRKGISIDLPTGKIADGDIPATVARMTDVVAAQAAAQAASQPLDADLTAYAGAASSAARRALINAEEAGAAAAALAACTVQVGLAEDAADAAALSAGTATTQAGLSSDSADAAALSAGTATTKAGEASVSAGTATTKAGEASGSAGAATTQAGISTTQAGISTAKALEATGSALDALAFRNEASGFKDTATAQAGIAAAQAGIATAQALIAAAKAAEAVNAQSVQYKGGVDGGFVPNTSALAGDYYLITANGSSQSKSWLVGERAVYNGTSGSWTQVTSPQIASAIVNTPAGGIAATTVQAALNELDTEKANLASPTFTGNPLAPTPATTDNDTSIATTAMVQAVANAQWTQPTAIAITAAGNSNVAAATAQNRYLTQRVNVTAFTGTATVTLQNTSAIAGDKRRLIVAMPAGAGNLIELRNLTSGGTLLATVPMDGALARTWVGYSTFDGTSWGAVSFSPMSVDEFVLSRTISRGDYIQSDGATPNRASGIYGPFDAVNNPREYVAGAASLTDFIQWTVPTANPSADILLVTRGAGSGGNYPWAVANSMGVWLDSPGNLSIAANGAVWATNKREFVRSGFRAAYSGQTVVLSFYLTNGTSNPVVKLNGVDISASFSVNNGASPVNWLDSAMVPTYRHVGYLWPSGPAPIVTPILGQTSAADDAFYMATGKWPAWVVAGGNPVNVLADVSRNGDFSAVATDWRGFGTSTVTLNTSTQALDVVATNGGCRLGSAGNPFNVTLSGRGVVFKVVLSNVSGGTVGCYNAAGGGFFQTFASGLTNGTHYITVSPLNKNGASDVDIAFGGAGVSFTIDDFVPVLAGALSLPAVQPINVIDDVSGIGGNQGRLLGCSPVTDERSTRILGRINAASATNQQILGGAVLPVPLNYAHEFVDVECDGSVTLSLGDGTTATRYTASTALTAGRTRIALTTPFAADAAKTGLYVNVTVAGGTYAQFSILGHLLK